MDVKRLKKNFNTLTKIIEKWEETPVDFDELSSPTSKIHQWWESNNFKMQRWKKEPENVYEAFSYLIYSNNKKISQCKTKLINYLESNSNKFDSFVKKNTDYDDINTFVDLLKTKSVDPLLEFVCLLSAYHRNLKILYEYGNSLKK